MGLQLRGLRGGESEETRPRMAHLNMCKCTEPSQRKTHRATGTSLLPTPAQPKQSCKVRPGETLFVKNDWPEGCAFLQKQLDTVKAQHVLQDGLAADTPAVGHRLTPGASTPSHGTRAHTWSLDTQPWDTGSRPGHRHPATGHGLTPRA